MKKILTLVFLVSLSASAFATWSVQHTASQKELYAIDGVTTASLARLCAVGNSGYVVLSTDYGTTWTAASGTITGTPNLRGVAIGTNYLYVGGSGKCFYSNDWGASWNDRSTGLPAIVNDVDFGNSTDGVIVGESLGGATAVLYTANGGSNWTNSTPASLPSVNAVHFVSATEAWIVGGSGHVWKSTDAGQNWTQKALTFGASPITSATLYDIHFYDANHGFIVGSSKNFLYTTDGGETWTLNTSALSTNDNFGVHAVDANTVWVVGEDPNPIISKLTYSAAAWSAATEYTDSSEHLLKVFLTNADNGWVAGYVPAGDVAAYGEILGQITDISISSIAQSAQPTQTTVYPGFSGNLKITGTNFQLGPWPTSSVAYSGSGATTTLVTYVSATELTATIAVDATAATGSRTVTVTNTDGMTDTHTLTIFPLPIVTSAQPSSLTQGATDQTVILYSSGGGFQSGLTTADISFGAGITVKSVVVDSDFQMTTVLDVSAGATTGSKTITINNPNGGSYASAGVFAVASASVTNPTITSAYPDMERNSTATLTILGSNMLTGATVSFSTGGITINSYDYSRLATENRLDVNITISNSAALGAITVTVINTDGGVGNLNQTFYIKDAGVIDPTFIAVQPTSAYQSRQDVDLYISGTGFQSGAQVSIISPGGVTITAVNVLSTTGIRITVDIDQNATLGMRGVLVVNQDGGHVLVTDKFEIKALTPTPQVVDNTARAGPNPWNPVQPVRIQFEMGRAAQVKIPVLNCNGREIYEFNVSAVAGHNSFTWDGSIYGGHVPNGMILMPLIVNGKYSGKKIKLMVVR